jgi:tellurite resistance protein TerC
MTTSLWFWGFNAGVALLLGADLLLINRDARVKSFRESTALSFLWILLSLGFNGVIWAQMGADRAMEFFTGYLIEYSLSVDNLFVFLVIFGYFGVEPRLQRRVLFWGIIGALMMRASFIAVGLKVVQRFDWTLYIMGAFILYTGLKLFFSSGEVLDIEENKAVQWCRKHLPISEQFHGARFVVKVSGKWRLTPLALVLVVIEFMDVVFAVDSIPAVFAVTQHPFIVYSSNVCAIIGLRSLYFVLAHMADRFVYLQYGLASVLSFIGCKMLLAKVWHIPTWISLVVVACCLAASIFMSLRVGRKDQS